MARMMRTMMMAMVLSLATMAGAQGMHDEYSVWGNKALYKGMEIREADVSTFQILGYGYAKDRNNVYLNGKVLPWVDPYSFKLKNSNYGHNGNRPGQGHHGNGHNGYHSSSYEVTSFDVYFNGKKVKGASATTFTILKDGYAKDAFNVYFAGTKIKGASAATFRVDQGGYAHDAFNRYYNGKKIR